MKSIFIGLKNFIGSNKVVIVSMLMALTLVLQQALSNSALDWFAIGYAAAIAVLGVIAKAWKGKGITIFGIIGTVAYAFVDIAEGGHFSLKQFFLSAIFALVMAAIRSLQPTTDKV